MLFSLLKHYLDTDTALKVSQSVFCFTTSISHGVENISPGCGVRSLMLFFIYQHGGDVDPYYADTYDMLLENG